MARFCIPARSARLLATFSLTFAEILEPLDLRQEGARP